MVNNITDNITIRMIYAENHSYTQDVPIYCLGRFHKCGYKFGKWYDMMWMEKMLGEHKTPPKGVLPIGRLKLKEKRLK